jgi:hypothetical protein
MVRCVLRYRNVELSHVNGYLVWPELHEPQIIATALSGFLTTGAAS